MVIAHHHQHLLLGPRSPWWLRLMFRLGHAALWPSRVHPAHLVPVLVHYLELVGVAAASVAAVAVAVALVRRLPVDGSTAGVSETKSRRFQVLLPESFAREGLTGFFRTVAMLLRPVLFGSQPSLAFTLTTVGERLEVMLDCDAELASSVRASLEAAIEGIAIDELPASAAAGVRRRWARCLLRPSGSRWLPLESKHKVDPARFVLAMLRGEGERERACVQVVFSPLSRRASRRGRREPRRLRTGRRGGALAGLGSFGLELANEGLDLFTPGSTRASTRTTTTSSYQPDGGALKRAGAIEDKVAEPLLAATIRLAASGGTRRSMRSRLHALASSFGQFQALGGLRAGRELFGRRRFERRLPALRPPLALTAAEAAALLPLPASLAETRLVLGEAPARRLPPAADAPTFGIGLGRAER